MVNKVSKGGYIYMRQSRLQVKNCCKRNEGHYIKIKVSIQQEAITITIYMDPILEHLKYKANIGRSKGNR